MNELTQMKPRLANLAAINLKRDNVNSITINAARGNDKKHRLQLCEALGW